MTFVVNQDGLVFQQNLGKGTTVLVAVMTRFDPDVAWARVDLMNDCCRPNVPVPPSKPLSKRNRHNVGCRPASTR